MDRSLDDAVSERQRGRYRGSRDRRPPRDGVRKSYQREEPRNFNHEWVHDRYDDEDDYDERPQNGRGYRSERFDRRPPATNTSDVGTRVRVENLHYDITERDLRDLFEEKGTVLKAQILYDRQDRSEGVAFVTYEDAEDARDAIADFNGAKAMGQLIRVSLLPSLKPRNPFDTAEPPRRSLFDRIEQPAPDRRRARSASPIHARHSDVSKPAPEHIDRYVPGEDSGRERRRSPRHRGPPRERGSRRPGDSRRRRGPDRDADGHLMVQGRPRKTVDELDAEMEDYWAKGETDDSKKNATANGTQSESIHLDDDIDMIE